MKKLLLFVAVTFISIATLNAQCTPDPQYTTPGVFPDSATGMSDACIGQVYDQLVTVIVPIDTCAQVLPAPLPCTTFDFDSIVITSFTGLPTGFTYTTNSPQNTTSPNDGGTFEGGTTGCMTITGNPTSAEVGVYPLTINLDVYVGGQLTPITQQTVDYYTIEVLDCASNGVEENTLSSIVAFPNPTKNVLTLNGLNGSTESISILNTNGQVMMSYSTVQSTQFEINVSTLESGIYFVKIIENNELRTIRFVKK